MPAALAAGYVCCHSQRCLLRAPTLAAMALYVSCFTGCFYQGVELKILYYRHISSFYAECATELLAFCRSFETRIRGLVALSISVSKEYTATRPMALKRACKIKFFIQRIILLLIVLDRPSKVLGVLAYKYLVVHLVINQLRRACTNVELVHSTTECMNIFKVKPS